MSLCTSLYITLYNGHNTVQLLLTTAAIAIQEWTQSKEEASHGLTQGGLIVPWILASIETFNPETLEIDLSISLLVSLFISLIALFQSDHPFFPFCSFLECSVVCFILFSFSTNLSSCGFIFLACSIHFVSMKYIGESFTVGEMNLYAQLLTYTIIYAFELSPNSNIPQYQIVCLIPRIITILLTFSITSSLLIRQWTIPTTRSLFCTVFLSFCSIFLSCLLVPMVLQIMTFVFESQTRCWILAYWGLCLISGVVIAKLIKAKTIIIRKCFHFLAILLFLPAQVLERSLLQVGLGVAFGFFCVVESLRLASIPYISAKINKFLHAFVDHRDKGPIIFSHFSLLLGLALPIWITTLLPLDSKPLQAQILSFSGLVILGIGDSFAAIIGTKYGHRHFVKGIDKSLEGSIACFVSCMIAWSVFAQFYPISLTSLILPTLAATIFEATSSQNDNIFVPLHYYSMLLLV